MQDKQIVRSEHFQEVSCPVCIDWALIHKASLLADVSAAPPPHLPSAPLDLYGQTEFSESFRRGRAPNCGSTSVIHSHLDVFCALVLGEQERQVYCPPLGTWMGYTGQSALLRRPCCGL